MFSITALIVRSLFILGNFTLFFLVPTIEDAEVVGNDEVVLDVEGFDFDFAANSANTV